MVLYHSVSALGIARRLEPAASGECWVDGSWSTLSGEADVEFTSLSSGELKLSRFTALLLGGRVVVPVYMCVCACGCCHSNSSKKDAAKNSI